MTPDHETKDSLELNACELTSFPTLIYQEYGLVMDMCCAIIPKFLNRRALLLISEMWHCSQNISWPASNATEVRHCIWNRPVVGESHQRVLNPFRIKEIDKIKEEEDGAQKETGLSAPHPHTKSY